MSVYTSGLVRSRMVIMKTNHDRNKQLTVALLLYGTTLQTRIFIRALLSVVHFKELKEEASIACVSEIW